MALEIFQFLISRSKFSNKTHAYLDNTFINMPPKRKRNAEPTLQEKLENHHNDIAKALKASKGFERQRMSKRVHEAGITPDKQERLEREISVLKVRNTIHLFVHNANSP